MSRRVVSLVVDPVSCDGHRVCAELFAERIHLDPWGFPLISGEEIPRHLLDHAHRSAESCPRLALLVSERRIAS